MYDELLNVTRACSITSVAIGTGNGALNDQFTTVKPSQVSSFSNIVDSFDFIINFILRKKKPTCALIGR